MKHTTQSPQPAFSFDEIPYGYCHCGCGEKTKISDHNDTRYGTVKGQPNRFVAHHHKRLRWGEAGPNPSGLCMCGCGQPAPIASSTSTRGGGIKGQPLRFIAGHCGFKGQPVRSAEERFWEHLEKRGPDECWPWMGYTDTRGYGVLKRHSKTIKAYRLSYELHFGPIPDGMLVCHHCDNPPCCNPKHLFLGTNKDNMDDMVSKGRQRTVKGEAQPTSKLIERQVVQMRQLASEGVTQDELALQFGVTQGNVSQIVLRKTWKHIP